MPDRPIIPIVYVTKYAFSKGIIVFRDAELTSPRSIMIRSNGYMIHFHGKDWHRSKGEATNRVEAMAATRKESLRRALAKLDGQVAKAEAAIQQYVE